MQIVQKLKLAMSLTYFVLRCIFSKALASFVAPKSTIPVCLPLKLTIQFEDATFPKAFTLSCPYLKQKSFVESRLWLKNDQGQNQVS